ncbi:hypothetical protein H5410_053564 [Solanum commersonii]|uniref:Nuclear factor related to kappa-B-binding protein second winged helix domain-containing protein n=1 Tax=Solanum commersonii TaxID=4109 RepID=A0A9J5X3U7_SOLCO|nr:hypothetical protein H5410_053564 [Solanum commersonii]
MQLLDCPEVLGLEMMFVFWQGTHNSSLRTSPVHNLTKLVSNMHMATPLRGGLDRLHYEDDPCVKYEREKRRWTYLHRDRQGEDFEDDST